MFESDHSDRIPVRTEIQILPADPALPPLGWTAREYCGCEVYLLGAFDMVEVRITEKSVLKPGTTIAVPGLMGGYHHMVVKDEQYAETPEGELGAFLRFGGDDRNCWMCTSLINTKCFEIIKATPP